jgi:hypothetical protein
MNLTFSAFYVGKLLVFDDSVGGRTPASTREQEMWHEILRLRSALAQMKEECAKVAEDELARLPFDVRAAKRSCCRIAAAIRSLPLEEKT